VFGREAVTGSLKGPSFRGSGGAVAEAEVSVIAAKKRVEIMIHKTKE
jgi:hypothetical protein